MDILSFLDFLLKFGTISFNLVNGIFCWGMYLLQ